MVVVEIRTPIYDEESSEITWRGLALVKADGQSLDIYGDADLVAVDEPGILDLATGKQLLASENPEVWARNLPAAFRAGDFVAVVVLDTDPPEDAHAPVQPDDLPSIPMPSQSTRLASGQRACV
jgi:hypothetical protein